MTFGQIRLICQKAGEQVDLDILDNFIQSRYTFILDASPWKALETPATLTVVGTSAGTRSITVLPANLKILLEVNNSTGNFPLRPYTQSELNLLYPGRLDTTTPWIYSMAEDNSATPPLHQVETYGTAAASLPIRYIAIPPNFDPTQTTLSPLPWIPAHVLINGVRADLCAYAKDFNGMQAFESLFTAGLNSMLRVEQGIRQPNLRASEEIRYLAAAQFPMPPGGRSRNE